MRTTRPLTTGGNVTGTPFFLPYFDSNGDIADAPGLKIDGDSFGLRQEKTFAPNDEGTYQTLNPAFINLNPLQDSPDNAYAMYAPQVNFDDASSGFGIGTSGEAATMYSPSFRHKGTGDIGGFNFFKQSFDIGNGVDPIDVKGMAYMLGFGSFQDGVTLTGPLQGYGFQPSATSGVIMGSASYANGFYDAANMACAVNGWASMNLSPTLAEIKNNTNYNGAVINPSIPLFTGNASAFPLGIFGNYGTFGTGGWQGITVNSNVTSAAYATGIYVNMGGVTASGTKRAIETVGDVRVDGAMEFTGALAIGQLNAFHQVNAIDGGGNPQGIHGLTSGIIGLANTTTANVDAIGVNTAMLMTLNTNSINTSGPFKLGFSALALPCVVETHTGSSLDHAAGATFALNFVGSSTGGTIENIAGARSVFIPNGITAVTNARGFYHDALFGNVGTNNWGYYSNGDCDNFFKGWLKLGGVQDSTDKVSSASIALEIDFTDRVLRLKPLSTAERDALTPSEGMVVPNGTTSKMQAYMGGAWVDLH